MNSLSCCSLDAHCTHGLFLLISRISTDVILTTKNSTSAFRAHLEGQSLDRHQNAFFHGPSSRVATDVL